MSVPGEVGTKQWAYLQIVLGYIVGYWVIASVLLPLYYRLNLTSIYTYLLDRFGNISYKTGAAFFLLSRTLGASIRVFLVVNMLQVFVLDQLGIPFLLTTFLIIAFILIYTYRGGVKTIVYTDTIQTTCMLLALILSIIFITEQLNSSFAGLWQTMQSQNLTQIFVWDWKDKSFFLKQFLSGMFITITMTGLDQEMMQKNLSVHTLSASQKNMISFSFVLIIVNLLFLVLGASLFVYAGAKGIAIPKQTDQLFPTISLQYLGSLSALIFLIGLISALYPSADGALTALTSSFCIDMLNLPNKPWDEKRKIQTRYAVHLTFAFIFLLCIWYFKATNNSSVITAVLTMASYTYGPLLGLYAFGLLTKKKINDRFTPLICIASPVICYFVNAHSQQWFNGYQLGFELLLLNGLLTFIGLWMISVKKNVPQLA